MKAISGIFSGQKDFQTLSLGEYKSRVDVRLKSWGEAKFIQKLWAKDPILWSPKPMPEITNRLGWLNLPENVRKEIDGFSNFTEEVKAGGVANVVLLGMGGSSLAPEVFQLTLGNAQGYPDLTVLDSTHPGAVRAVEAKVDLRHTLFLVSSKSGTTLETLSLFRYFWKRAGQVNDNPGKQFVAITDAESPLAKLAQERKFRRVFQAPADVGGRYSALSVFGMLPAALIGVKTKVLLDRAKAAAEDCGPSIQEEKSSSLALGAALGELARAGRDKVTFFTSPSLKHFPVWLEQLIAESTGKDGKGIVPVVKEPPASSYGNDRLFVYLDLDGESSEFEDKLKVLDGAGHPTIRISLAEKADIAREMFRWEVAVAAAGAVLSIHPFNQPDVQLTKDLTKQAMEKKTPPTEDVESIPSDDAPRLSKALENWMARARPGDYLTIQSFLARTPEATEALQNVRLKLLKRSRLTTTLGYGPRFLHSTGQLHKGGPNTGLFLQLVDEAAEDIQVPETDYSFGSLVRSQALGDYKALKQRGRRVLRIDLKEDVAGGLARLAESVR